ncbi:hypothetical protein KGM_210072A, partial [Danaus plexippus plexippus]
MTARPRPQVFERISEFRTYETVHYCNGMQSESLVLLTCAYSSSLKMFQE